MLNLIKYFAFGIFTANSLTVMVVSGPLGAMISYFLTVPLSFLPQKWLTKCNCFSESVPNSSKIMRGKLILSIYRECFFECLAKRMRSICRGTTGTRSQSKSETKMPSSVSSSWFQPSLETQSKEGAKHHIPIKWKYIACKLAILKIIIDRAILSILSFFHWWA